MLKVPVDLCETQKPTQEQGGIVYSKFAAHMCSEFRSVAVGARSYQFWSSTRTEQNMWLDVLCS